MAEFRVPINLVIKVKDIEEIELEDYIAGIQLAIAEAFYSTDPEDDHYEVMLCSPEWDKIRKEVNLWT